MPSTCSSTGWTERGRPSDARCDRLGRGVTSAGTSRRSNCTPPPNWSISRSQPEWLFETLIEGVLAAVWCVEQRLWRPDEDGAIGCDRDTMPSRYDRNHPPWITEPHSPQADSKR